MQDCVFQGGLQNAVRQVIQQKQVAEDMMSNVLFQARWAEVTKVRSEELIAEKLATQLIVDDPVDDVKTLGFIDTTTRGIRPTERCEPGTKEFWDSFAAQLVRQYVRLAVEPQSAFALSNEVKNSVLDQSFKGEVNKSTVTILLEIDNLQECANRPMDRKPPPNQAVIAKLLGGVMAARGGATNDDGLRVSPADQDIILMCDGSRDQCKNALRATWYFALFGFMFVSSFEARFAQLFVYKGSLNSTTIRRL
jgi:hypothetical protein